MGRCTRTAAQFKLNREILQVATYLPALHRFISPRRGHKLSQIMRGGGGGQETLQNLDLKPETTTSDLYRCFNT